jgi:small subunit ribosomal protein S13
MRIFGISIPDNKHLSIALTEVYGVGRPRALKVLAEAKVDPTRKAPSLTTEEENTIRTLLEAYTLEGNLRRETGQNIKRLKDILSYRGSRHSRGLPVRGQRTRVNSRTVRGNKRSTMGSGKIKVSKT